MIGHFEICLAVTEKMEGGNDDDPRDPGGRTSRGITQREYDAWQHLHKGAHGDVWAASDAAVSQIYQHSYWLPYCDLLPFGIDMMYFDTVVNEGAAKAVLFLQRSLKITDDGHFGVATIAAVKVTSALPGGSGNIVKAMADERRVDYHRMKRLFRTFGKGWMDRVDQVEQIALRMANDGLDPAPKVVA